jgi:hypothetical protein
MPVYPMRSDEFEAAHNRAAFFDMVTKMLLRGTWFHQQLVRRLTGLVCLSQHCSKESATSFAFLMIRAAAAMSSGTVGILGVRASRANGGIITYIVLVQ